MSDPTWDNTQAIDPDPPPPQNSGIPTWDNTQSMEEKYGGVSGAAKAAALSAADTATFGGSTYGLTRSGLVNPETINSLYKQNPASTMAGIPIGIIGSLAIGPESAAAKAAAEAAELAGGSSKAIAAAKAAANSSLTGFEAADLLNPARTISRLGGTIADAVAPAAEGIAGQVLGQAGAHALGSVAEAQFYTLGNAVSESALGDPDAFGEKLVSNMGTNALFGGALGALFGGIKGLSASKELANDLSKELTRLGDSFSSEVRRKRSLPGEPGPPPGGSGGSALLSNTEMSGTVTDAPKTGVQPTSLQALRDKRLAAEANGTAIELPQKSVLEDAVSRVPMENPINPLQMGSLEDAGKRDSYNIVKDSDTETGKDFRHDEAVQKNELVNKTGQTINDISPSAKPTSDAMEGGNRAIKDFTDQYQAKQEFFGQQIKELKSLKGEGFDHTDGVIRKWIDANPELAKVFKIDEDGIKMNPYDTTMGVTKQTYRAAKDAFNALQKNPQDFKSLFNIRKGLENGVNLFTTDAATRGEIMKLKSSMMDYIQSLIDKTVPEAREVFRGYAINEQERSVIEKAFGASVGSPEFGAMSKIKPEHILDRIFANSASTQAAKNILGPNKFNEVLANWLSVAKEKATTDGAFSSKNFSLFLRKNKDVLGVAFKENPEILQRIGDLTTIMRILPDAAPANPSGTAKTLIGMLKNIPHNISWEKMLSYLPQKALEYLEHQSQLSSLNEELAGKSAKVDGLSLIERNSASITRSINSVASSIFSGKTIESSAIAISAKERSDNHDNVATKLNAIASNPQKLIDHISDNTEALSQVAPKTAESAQATMTRAIQFLQSKLPGANTPQKPLSQPYKPSDTELSKWHKYYSAIENPTGILQSVATGNLVPEQIEAVSAVTPKIMQEMQSSVMDQMSKHLSQKKTIPYKTKLSLSLFMGEDLVNSLNPVNMLSNQNMLATATQAKDESQDNSGRISKPAIGKMKQSNRFLTPMQGSAQRQDT
jgi:hypothetical protein